MLLEAQLIIWGLSIYHISSDIWPVWLIGSGFEGILCMGVAAGHPGGERVTSPFKPDWTIAPAATLQEWMEEQDAILPDERIQEVLNRKPLTSQHAELLEQVTGIPARFWLALEHNYRAGLAAGLKDVT